MSTRQRSRHSKTHRATTKSHRARQSGPFTHTNGVLRLQHTHGNHAVSRLLHLQRQIEEEELTGSERHPADDTLTAGNADGQQLPQEDNSSQATDTAHVDAGQTHANHNAVIQRAQGGLPPEAVSAIKKRRRLYESPEEEEERERAEQERQEAFEQLPNLDAADYAPQVQQGPQQQQNAQQPAAKKESGLDKTKDIYDKVQTGVGFATGGAGTVRLGTNTGMTASYTGSGSAPTVPGYLGGPLFGALAANSAAGLGSSGYGWYKARKTRGSKDATSVEKQKAWKDEKTAVKGIGSGIVDTVGAGIGVASEAGSSAAAAALAPAFGVGYGINAARNLYGGARAGYKAAKLQGTKSRLAANRAALAAQEQRTQNKGHKKSLRQQREKTEELEGLAGFTRNRKLRTVGEKSIGTISAGLGIAGLAAGATPVGWGLLAGSAAVGLGAAAWKGVKGFNKRRKRLKKIAKVREQLDGKKRGKGWVAKQLFFGGRMSKKRESTKKRYDQADDASKSAVTAEQLERTQKTTKERKATRLVEKMLDPDPAISGPARDIGRTLGVLNKAGHIKKSRGWKFWKKKEDMNLYDVANEKDGKGKEHLAALLARKL